MSAVPVLKPNGTFGSHELCCWDIGAGEVKIQTRSPVYRKAIAQLPGFRKVAQHHAGGFLLVYQGKKTFESAVRFVRRQLDRNSPQAESLTIPGKSESVQFFPGKAPTGIAQEGLNSPRHTETYPEKDRPSYAKGGVQ